MIKSPLRILSFTLAAVLATSLQAQLEPPKKISAMTAASSLTGTDIFEVTIDPGGTPLTRKGTIGQIGDWLDSATLTLTNKAISGADNTLSNIPPSALAGSISLANGGTGAALTDPGADRIFFWDDSAGATDWLTLGPGLTIAGGNALGIADDGVTNAQLANFPAGSLLGNATGSGANPTHIDTDLSSATGTYDGNVYLLGWQSGALKKFTQSFIGTGFLLPASVGGEAFVIDPNMTQNVTDSDTPLDDGIGFQTLEISTSGTYVIYPTVTVRYSGVTTASSRTISLEVKTSGGASLFAPVTTLKTGVLTTQSYPSQTVAMAPFVYAASGSPSLNVWAVIDTAPSAGNIVVEQVHLRAIRIK